MKSGDQLPCKAVGEVVGKGSGSHVKGEVRQDATASPPCRNVGVHGLEGTSQH